MIVSENSVQLYHFGWAEKLRSGILMYYVPPNWLTFILQCLFLVYKKQQ